MRKRPVGLHVILVFIIPVTIALSVSMPTSIPVYSQEIQSSTDSERLTDQFIEELATELAKLSKILDEAGLECMKLGKEQCQKFWFEFWLDICRNAKEFGLTCNIKQ